MISTGLKTFCGSAIKRFTDHHRLSPDIVIRAYSLGIFPMASSRNDPTIHWVAPAMRGVLPLDAFHVPRRLRKVVRGSQFDVRCNTDFEAVIAGCAEPRPGHPETWINDEIARAFSELHTLGHAHSVEAWEDGRLVGGLYGVALGGVFFGESMFSRRTDASKVALVHLVARLRLGRFAVLDVQFVTDHLRRFGAIEIPAPMYLQKLEQGLRHSAIFPTHPSSEDLAGALSSVLTQSSTQTS